MASPTGWVGHRRSTELQKNFLDLEDVSLQQIVAALSIQDRKNIALTCKALCMIVRSQWRTLVVNILEEDDPPPGIAHFRSLERVIWDDGSLHLGATLADNEWESSNPPMEHPDKRNVPELSARSFKRLRHLTDLVSTAIGAPRPKSVYELEEDDDPIAVKFRNDVARRLKPIHDFVVDATQHMHGIGYEDQSLAEHFANLDAANYDDDYDDGVFAPARGYNSTADENLENDGYQGQTSQQQQQQQRERMDDEDVANGRPSTSRASNDKKQLSQNSNKKKKKKENSSNFLPQRPLQLIITAPLVLSGIDFKSLLFHARPVWDPSISSLVPRHNSNSVVDACNTIIAYSHPLPLPYSDVDLGWFEVDGHLPVQAIRGTASWCYHSPSFYVEEGTGADYSRLRELRICIRDCEVDNEESAVAFTERVLPHLNSNVLPALQELHIGRPFSSGQQMQIDFSRIQLPQLTRLVLNEMIYFEDFDQLTVMSSLRSISISMPAAGFEAQPQDLASFSKLRDLRSLKIEYWEVEAPQDVSALQQLTELELEGMEGRVHLTKPSRPMPNLAGVALTRLPRHQDMRYREDSKFARWGLRHASEVFPNVEVLHLGTLGSAPASVNNDSDLLKAAEYVDGHVRNLLSTSGSHGLQYLQLDTVLNIMDDSLDKRCETGSVRLIATIEVATLGVEDFKEKTNSGLVKKATTKATTRTPSIPPASNSNVAATGASIHDGTGVGVEGANSAAAAVPAEDDDDDMEDADVAGVDALELNGFGPVVLWERTVEFVTCEPTEVLVAEFHYRKIVSEEEIDTSTMC